MKTKIEKDLGMCDQKEREFMEELYRKYYRLKLTTEVYDANGKFVEDDVTYSGVESH